MTGSAAIEVARVLDIPFVQEVVATTHAVRTLEPDADVVIELGGEDAKIIYLSLIHISCVRSRSVLLRSSAVLPRLLLN